MYHGQIFAESLGILKGAGVVDGFDISIYGPYEDQFESETIFAAGDAFFIFVVVGGGAHVSEDEFRNPYVMFGMFDDINTIAIVDHGDFAGGRVTGDIDTSDGVMFYIIGIGGWCG